MDKIRRIGFLSDLDEANLDVRVIMSGRDYDEYQQILAQLEQHRDKNGNLPTKPKKGDDDYEEPIVGWGPVLGMLGLWYYATRPATNLPLWMLQNDCLVGPLTALVAHIII